MITKNSSGTSLSANYDTAVATAPRQWQVQLYVNSTLLSCGIKSLEITKGSCGSTENFAIGNVYSSMLTAELVKLTTDIKGEDIEVRVGLLTGASTWEWVTVGWFTAIKVVKTVYATNVTAYGFTLSKTAGSFVVPATLSLYNIASAIQTATGKTVTFDTGINTAYVLAGTLDEASCYGGLQALAHAVGGYATDTYDGNFAIHKFSDTSTLSVATDRMLDAPDVEEQAFTITGVQVTATGQYTYSLTTDVAIDPDKTYYTYDSVNHVYVEVENPVLADIGTYYERFDVVYTSGTPIVLYDENPNMSADVFTIYDDIVGYSYYTGNIDLSMGDPRIEGNDVLEVTDVDSNTYTVPCHIVTHTFDGGWATSIRAVNATDSGDGLVSNAPITQQIDQISTATAVAKASAESAVQYAEQAQASATRAYNLASQVEGLAQQASDNATLAQNSADSAVSSANIALDQLGIVEDVVGVLDLISKNGNYQVTTDTEVQPNKWYFTRSGTSPNYVYTVVENPTAIRYVLTSDVAIDPSKTYYTRSGAGTGEDPYVYTVVESPDISDIGTYYECIYYELTGIKEAIQNYVSNQLVVDDRGLWLKRPDSTSIQTKVLLSSTDGIVLYGTDGAIVGKYGATAQIGDAGGFHIDMGVWYKLTEDTAIDPTKTYYTRSGVEPNYTYTEVESPVLADIGTYYEQMPAELGFYEKSKKVAYINNDQLYITKTVVLQQMELGTPTAQGGADALGQWSWKVHPNKGTPQRNNLNLKWNG